MPKANDKLPYEEPAKFNEELFCASIEACSCLYDKGDENYHRSDAVDAAWHEVKKIHHFTEGGGILTQREVGAGVKRLVP